MYELKGLSLESWEVKLHAAKRATLQSDIVLIGDTVYKNRTGVCGKIVPPMRRKISKMLMALAIRIG